MVTISIRERPPLSHFAAPIWQIATVNVEADLAMMERTLHKLAPPSARARRFRANDQVASTDLLGCYHCGVEALKTSKSAERRGTRLLSLVVWALAADCGARSGLDDGEPRFVADAAASVVIPSATPAPSIECPPSILSYEQPDAAFYGCWSCVARGCPSEWAACAADCACNGAVLKALDCVNGGGTPGACFSSIPGVVRQGSVTMVNEPALGSLTTCLLMSGNCGCQFDSPLQSIFDASAACPAPIADTGGTSVIGHCTSSLQMACDGNDYQVICSCPQAQCACLGTSSHFIKYTGCPYCSFTTPGQPPSVPTPSELFAQCGFPH